MAHESLELPKPWAHAGGEAGQSTAPFPPLASRLAALLPPARPLSRVWSGAASVEAPLTQ